ncbi:MAG: N-acetylneuraminate synthase [Nitratireductor sp.]|nr:N-acetylneuraminate synthase [Nitratireductor sp.]
MNNHVLIIAEAGVNHNGDMALALGLVEAAAEAGADYVKFQTFSADRLVTRDARTADYQKKQTGGETQYEMLKRLELDREMHEQLIAHCNRFAIHFFSTGFDIESVEMLRDLGQRLFKIPSGEITNLPFLRHLGGLGCPLILSTGMATLDEITEAINTLETAGMKRSQITVLHCTTEYPAPMGEVNLRAMVNMRQELGVETGYSDHTEGIEITVAAASLGASVIEKHFTLDRKLPGPDHRASLEPAELKAMISAIRNVEKALGDGIKRASESEMRNMATVRKSVVAACDIPAGDIFTEQNLAVKRPGTGISPMRWEDILGRTASRSYLADELIDECEI